VIGRAAAARAAGALPEHGFEFMEPAAAERLGIPGAGDRLFGVSRF
jgi:hypothetical protein